jgi:predicted phosphodiesterase
MRLAIVSDIHGNLPALQAVLADIAIRGADAIVNLGDSLSGPLLPLETAEFLMAQPWVQLAGNHERQLLDFDPQRRGRADRFAHARLTSAVFEWMARLRPAQAFDREVFLCHATPASDLVYLLESFNGEWLRPAGAAEVEQRLGDCTAPVVICGHSHVPRIMRSPRGQLLVNPGSVGLQAFAAGEPQPHRVETGGTDARYAIVERGAAGWAAQLLAVPYDHAAAAELAAANGSADWAFALRTGYAWS